MEDKKPPQPPPGPPCRMFKQTLFGNEVETKKSIQWQRDYLMFMKGWRFAHGEPNVPQPGDYV
jgi:hypothetical protein